MKKTAWLLIVFSGFFITLLPISPIYVATGIAVLFLFFNTIRTKAIYFNSTMFLALMFVIYLLFSQNLGVELKTNANFNVVFSLFYFILVLMSIYNLSINQITNISKKFIRISIILLICEAAWRVSHPIYTNFGMDDSSFYQYKYSSFMYEDSNFVGIFIVSLFFLCLYLKRYHCMKLNLDMFILALLSLLTFSRASIISIILFLFLFGIKSIGKKIYFSIILGSIGIFLFSQYISTDVSFLARLHIIEVTLDFLKSTTYHNVLFGVGFGNTVNYLGIGAHNFIVTYLIESGIVGFGFLIALWLSILKQTKYRAAIIMIPFLLNGMLLAGHAIPYLYCIFAIVYALEKKHNAKVSTSLVKNHEIKEIKNSDKKIVLS